MNEVRLERYASVSLAMASLGLVHDGIRRDDLTRIEKAQATGDRRLDAWLDEASSSLRQAIVTIENMLDPQAVILGGVLPRPVLAALIERILSLPRKRASLTLAGAGLSRLALFHIAPEIRAGRLRPVLEHLNPDDVEPVHAVFLAQGGHLPARVRAFIDYLAERTELA